MDRPSRRCSARPPRGWRVAVGASRATRRSSTRWRPPPRRSGGRSRRARPFPRPMARPFQRAGRACAPRGTSSRGAAWPSASGNGRSVTSIPVPCRACSCCVPWGAVSDRADLQARIDALERESRRAFDAAQREADALFAQYQLSQLMAAGGSLESVARSVTAEVVRLADVDGGALWFGGPEGPELTLLASIGGEPPGAPPIPTALATLEDGRRWCCTAWGPHGRLSDETPAILLGLWGSDGRTPDPDGHPGRPAGTARAGRRVPERPAARDPRARTRRADGRRRRHDRRHPPGRWRPPGRPAQPGRRAPARHPGR